MGILLIVAAAAYRVASTLFLGVPFSNVAPLMAIALCGGLFLPRFWAWGVPLAALLASDLVLDLHYGVSFVSLPTLGIYSCYVAAIFAGRALRGKAAWTVLAASLGASFLFYAVTNSLAWLADPGYAKTFAGWAQALTTGLPGYPPTWMFFRNSAAGDLLFTGLCLGCLALSRVRMAAATETVGAR